MPRSEYSMYNFCVCSHMRLVVYTKSNNGDGLIGWFHVSKNGTLENFSEPCQAQIHRVEMEWPMLTIDQALVDTDAQTGKRRDPTPSTTTLFERIQKSHARP